MALVAAAQVVDFAGRALVQRQVECASGTVPHTALTAAASNQEITIQTGIAGNVRWDQVLISETTQFAGATGLTVSMGRPGPTNNSEMSGALLPLMVSRAAAGDVRLLYRAQFCRHHRQRECGNCRRRELGGLRICSPLTGSRFSPRPA